MKNLYIVDFFNADDKNPCQSGLYQTKAPTASEAIDRVEEALLARGGKIPYGSFRAYNRPETRSPCKLECLSERPSKESQARREKEHAQTVIDRIREK